MKILVISTNGIIKDGITEWIISIFGAMDKTGIQVHTVAFENADLKVLESVCKAGIIPHLLPSRKLIAQYCCELRKLMREMRFDVVHVCGNSATVAIELSLAKLAEVRMRIAHSHNTRCSHPVIDKALRPVMNRTLTDRVACGKDAGEWLFGNKRFSVIPNGKDIDRFRFRPDIRTRARKSLGLSDSQIAIGHVGMFTEQKNHAFLFKVFYELKRRNNRYHLYLMGDGRLRSELQDEVKRLGISDDVSFLGWRKDVPELLNAMDCMVFPSLFEGLPNVVVEWQINGLPCVLSSEITRECAFTSLVRFISLSESALRWGNAVETALTTSERESDSLNAVLAAREAGYDINENAKTLRMFYLRGYHNESF